MTHSGTEPEIQWLHSELLHYIAMHTLYMFIDTHCQQNKKRTDHCICAYLRLNITTTTTNMFSFMFLLQRDMSRNVLPSYKETVNGRFLFVDNIKFYNYWMKFLSNFLLRSSLPSLFSFLSSSPLFSLPFSLFVSKNIT